MAKPAITNRTARPSQTGVLGTNGGATVIPALWAKKKYFTQQGSILDQKVTIDFKKAGISNEFIKRIILRLSGTIDTGAATAGTATGLDNPEGLLSIALLQTNPVQQNLLPVNGVSGRGFRWDRGVQRGRLIAYSAITDGSGVIAVNFEYEIFQQRRGNFPHGVRQAVEYGLDSSKYQSIVLTLTFGGKSALFTGSPTNIWDGAGLVLEMFLEVGYLTYPPGLHATEIYEQVFPVTANGDFLINQLPAGCFYDEIILLTEKDNLLTDGIIDNIDVEGAGRTWMPAGDNNANFIRDILSTDAFDGSVSIANLAGAYVIENEPDGSFLRAIDARNSQILIKPHVVGWVTGHPTNLRLICRKVVPYGVMQKGAAGTDRS